MASETKIRPMTKADARVMLRKEASFFLGKKTPEEKVLLRTANNVSFIIQDHHGEEGLIDMHKDIFGGLNRLKQEYIDKAGTFLTTCLTKYKALQQVTMSHMASSDLKWNDKMSQTPCKFFKQGICKNGHKCPYLHKKGKTKKGRVDTGTKNLNPNAPRSKDLNIVTEHIAPMQQQITALLESVGKITKHLGETAAVTNILKEEYCRDMTKKTGIRVLLTTILVCY